MAPRWIPFRLHRGGSTTAMKYSEHIFTSLPSSSMKEMIPLICMLWALWHVINPDVLHYIIIPRPNVCLCTFFCRRRVRLPYGGHVAPRPFSPAHPGNINPYVSITSKPPRGHPPTFLHKPKTMCITLKKY